MFIAIRLRASQILPHDIIKYNIIYIHCKGKVVLSLIFFDSVHSAFHMGSAYEDYM